MKMNNKGFTLIELLAVVVIMLAISVMAVSSISSAIERNKKKQTAAKIKVIESNAELYYTEHRKELSSRNCLSLNELDLSDKERMDSDGKYFDGCVLIFDDIKYESDNDNCKSYGCN